MRNIFFLSLSIFLAGKLVTRVFSIENMLSLATDSQCKNLPKIKILLILKLFGEIELNNKMHLKLFLVDHPKSTDANLI